MRHPQIGRFQIVGELGRGGFGEVVRAFDPQRGREVAIKILIRGDLKAARRFEREVAAAARLVHPNVVASLESGVHEGRPFLVMEFVEGNTLESLASGRERALSPSRAAELLREIACGVAYAHSQGVLHRDIKPANVLVDRKGVARLLDFGLAFLVDSNERLSLTGAMLGTPFFMAPEQAVGKRADERTDVYGLGATLYFCLTGDPPFADAANPIVATHATPAEPPSQRRPEVPAPLDRIVLRAMAKEPDQRQESVEALIEELDAFLRGDLGGGPRRRWAAALPAASLAAVLCAALAGGALVATQSSQVAATPTPTPSASPPPTPAVSEPAAAADASGNEAAEQELVRSCEALLEAMAPAAALTQPLERAAEAGAGAAALERWRGCQRVLADAEALQRDACRGGAPEPFFQRLEDLRRAANQHALLVDRLRIERVRLELRRGRSEQALRTLRPLRGRFEGAADFLYCLALYRLGRYSEGNVALAKVREGASLFWTGLAYTLMAAGSPESEERNRAQLQANPHPHAPPEVELLSLTEVIASRSHAEARQRLESSLYGDDAYLWSLLASKGRSPLSEAEAILRRVEGLCGKDHLPAHYYRTLGLMHISAGRFSDALEPLQRAKPGRGGEVSTMVLEGVALWGMGRLREADRCWKSAFERDEAGAFSQVGQLRLPTARLAAETAMNLPPRDVKRLKGALERAKKLAQNFPDDTSREAVESLLQAATRGLPLAVMEPLLRRCRELVGNSPVYVMLEARILLSRCAFERCRRLLDQLQELASQPPPSLLHLRLDLALAVEDSEAIEAALDGLEKHGREEDRSVVKVWRLWGDDDEGALRAALELRAKSPYLVPLAPLTCYLLRKAGRIQEGLAIADEMFHLFGYLDLGFARLRAVFSLEAAMGGARFDPALADSAFQQLGVLDRLGDQSAALELAQAAVLTDRNGMWFHSLPYWLLRYRREKPADGSFRAVLGAYHLRRGAPKEMVLEEWQQVRQPLPESYLKAYQQRFGEPPPTQGR